MPDEKVNAALMRITDEAAKITPASREAMLSALDGCRQALRRAAKRAETLPEEYERVEIVQDRGPVVEFTGRKLGDTRIEPKGSDKTIDLEIWQTEAGGYVAVTLVQQFGGTQWKAVPVEATGDQQAMRFAVMDAFNWSNHARKMAAKLGWSLRRDL